MDVAMALKALHFAESSLFLLMFNTTRIGLLKTVHSINGEGYV